MVLCVLASGAASMAAKELPIFRVSVNFRFSGGYGVRRRDPLDAARITADGPGPIRARAARPGYAHRYRIPTLKMGILA